MQLAVRMNVALIMGRSGSKSIRGKNLMPVLGRPLVLYPMLAALNAAKIDRVAITTDCPEMLRVAREYGIETILRPQELSHDSAQMVDGIVHALGVIGPEVKFLATLHANCATHSEGLIDRCITRLENAPAADACVSGVVDRAIHPFRTRKLTDTRHLVPWVNVPSGTSSNRQSLEPCVVLDGAIRVIRVATCFPPAGTPPFPYLGRDILFEENPGGRDIHSEDDVILTEHYLLRNGWTKERCPAFIKIPSGSKGSPDAVI